MRHSWLSLQGEKTLSNWNCDRHRATDPFIQRESDRGMRANRAYTGRKHELVGK